MSPESSDDARQSVAALLNDLRYVMGEMPAAEWPETAKAVLEHHYPTIDESLLTRDQASLQRWCRAVLDGLASSDADTIRAAILKVRQYEDSVAVPAN